MDRIEIIQKIINRKKAKNYLEVGVCWGNCFLKIKAKRKVGVDPTFMIDWEIRKDTLVKRAKRILLNRYAMYFKETSDAFFQNNKTFLSKNKPEVVLIDGLHTFEQSYTDAINALNVIDDKGIIILHDCNPQSEVEAYPVESYSEALDKNLAFRDGTWSGDVWKTIVKLRSTIDNIEVIVLDCDCGLGIIRKTNNSSDKLKLDKDVSKLEYSYLAENREKILNLKPVEYFETFLNKI